MIDLLLLNTRIARIDQPADGLIAERVEKGTTTIAVSGRVGWLAKSVEYAEAKGDADSIAPGAWKVLDPSPRRTHFHGSIPLGAGWHKVSFRSEGDGYRQANDVLIGVGEVFVVAGQSNGAGSSKTLFLSTSEDVHTGHLDGGSLTWGRADDPQTSGSGGSVWPLVGAELAARLRIPIGFVNMAVGATSLDQWRPGGPLQTNLVRALRLTKSTGVRAVLWHQGESDKRTSRVHYAEGLKRLITQTRAEVGGTPVPWMVAQVSYGFGSTGEGVRAAQASLWQNAVALRGPDTDGLGADYRESDNVHFNAAGTRGAAKLWVETIMQAFFSDVKTGAEGTR